MFEPPPSLATIKIADDAPVVATTFAGCGGSSTGYKLAGFRVAWASEFEPNAAECYRANHPTTIVDTRDVRTVRGGEILAAIGLERGELDLFDGSPPCQSFSTAGRKAKGWGRELTHIDGTKQRSDDLFFEYLRLVDELRPRVFVAENVSGMVKGASKGMFKVVLAEMRKLNYRVEARLIDAKWLGVPQSRSRIVFVGVRNDLETEPKFPTPMERVVSLDQACPWLVHADIETPTIEPEAWLPESSTPFREWHDPSGKLRRGSFYSRRLSLRKPSCCILASDGTSGLRSAALLPHEPRRLSIAELRRVCSFPDDYVLLGSYQQQWARLGNSVPPLMTKAIAETIRRDVLCR